MSKEDSRDSLVKDTSFQEELRAALKKTLASSARVERSSSYSSASASNERLMGACKRVNQLFILMNNVDGFNLEQVIFKNSMVVSMQYECNLCFEPFLFFRLNGYTIMNKMMISITEGNHRRQQARIVMPTFAMKYFPRISIHQL